MGVKITDTALRNTHQSLLAVQMHTLTCHSERPSRPSGLPALRREGIWGGADRRPRGRPGDGRQIRSPTPPSTSLSAQDDKRSET